MDGQTSQETAMPLAATAHRAPPTASFETAPTDPAMAGFVAVPRQFFDTAARLGEAPAHWVRQEQGWQPTTWQAYAAQVKQAARALLALGIQPGDAVAILAFNSPQWTTLAFAAQSIGATPAGVYWTSATDDVRYILAHCQARIVLVDDAERLAKVQACRAQLPALQTVVCIDPKAIAPGMQAIAWQAFIGLGLPGHDEALSQRLGSLRPEQPATLIYTSGTTGPAKAVVLSHGNLWWTASAMSRAFDVTERDRLLSYLPLAHIAEQMGSLYNQVYGGYAVYFARSMEALGEHLKEVHPTVFFGVPRVWEKMQSAIDAKLQTATGLKASLATWAMRVGRRWHAQTLAGQRPSQTLNLQYKLAHKLVFSKVQAALGFDQARLLSSGAAPIAADSLRFFTGLGMVVREVYGQSEVSGPSTMSLPGATKLGSVGKAMPGSTLRVDDDGELLVAGPHVFQGYLANAQATAETMDGPWLRTGDLGHIDEEGFVFITGRKKDLIITSGGKNISPANIEAALMDSPLIEHAVVCGDGRHYLCALLSLDELAVQALARSKGQSMQSMRGSPVLHQAIEQAIEHVNQGLARVAQVRKFALLPAPLTVAGGELTPTLKVKRKVVIERHQALINALYEDTANAPKT